MDKIVSIQRDKVERPPKRRAVGAKEREAIIVASIEGQSQPEIAEKFGRSPHTVRAILRSEVGKKRTAELLSEIAHAARSTLCRAARRAAESWVRQLELVGRGPARESFACPRPAHTHRRPRRGSAEERGGRSHRDSDRRLVGCRLCPGRSAGDRSGPSTDQRDAAR